MCIFHYLSRVLVSVVLLGLHHKHMLCELYKLFQTAEQRPAPVVPILLLDKGQGQLDHHHVVTMADDWYAQYQVQWTADKPQRLKNELAKLPNNQHSN